MSNMREVGLYAEGLEANQSAALLPRAAKRSMSVRHFASVLVRQIGCANFFELCGVRAVRYREMAAPSETLEELCAAGDFVWVSKDAGWFTLTQTLRESAPVKLARKVAAVATVPVTIPEFMRAFSAEHDLAYPGGGQASRPSTLVMRQTLADVADIPMDKGMIAPSSTCSVLGVLSFHELLAFEAITKRGGVASMKEICQHAEDMHGVEPHKTKAELMKMAIVLRVDVGVYALVGRPVRSLASQRSPLI